MELARAILPKMYSKLLNKEEIYSMADDTLLDFFPIERPRVFIVRKITKLPNGQPRKRPVWKRDNKIYKTLKAAKAGIGGRTIYLDEDFGPGCT